MWSLVFFLIAFFSAPAQALEPQQLDQHLIKSITLTLNTTQIAHYAKRDNPLLYHLANLPDPASWLGRHGEVLDGLKNILVPLLPPKLDEEFRKDALPKPLPPHLLANATTTLFRSTPLVRDTLIAAFNIKQEIADFDGSLHASEPLSKSQRMIALMITFNGSIKKAAAHQGIYHKTLRRQLHENGIAPDIYRWPFDHQTLIASLMISEGYENHTADLLHMDRQTLRGNLHRYELSISDYRKPDRESLIAAMITFRGNMRKAAEHFHIDHTILMSKLRKHGLTPGTYRPRLDRQMMIDLLIAFRGNQRWAAKYIDINHCTLCRILSKLKIKREDYKIQSIPQGLRTSLATFKGDFNRAAEEYGMSPEVSQQKLKEHGLSRDNYVPKLDLQTIIAALITFEGNVVEAGKHLGIPDETLKEMLFQRDIPVSAFFKPSRQTIIAALAVFTGDLLLAAENLEMSLDDFKKRLEMYSISADVYRQPVLRRAAATVITFNADFPRAAKHLGISVEELMKELAPLNLAISAPEASDASTSQLETSTHS